MGERYDLVGVIYNVRKRVENEDFPPAWKGQLMSQIRNTEQISDKWHEFQVALVDPQSRIIARWDSFDTDLSKIPGLREIVSKWGSSVDYLKDEHCEELLSKAISDVEESDSNVPKYFPTVSV